MAVATGTAILAAAALGTGAAVYGSSQASKAQSQAETFANEQQRAAEAEQKRLEEKYGLTTGELEREQRLFGLKPGEEKISLTGGLEQKTQAEKERRASMSGEELLAEGGTTTKALLDTIAKRLGMSGEDLFREIGGTASQYADIISQDLQDPYADYQSTLEPELELARQMVNAEANKRGVFAGQPEGGIRFEQLGRAGVDLAIKSASERMAYRQQTLTNAVNAINAYSTLQTGARSEAAGVADKALSEKERARAELDTLLANMQNLQSTAKGREANVAVSGAQLVQNQRAITTDELMGMYGTQAAQGNELVKSGLSLAGDILTSTPAKTTTTKTSEIALNDLLNQPNYNSRINLKNLSGNVSLN